MKKFLLNSTLLFLISISLCQGAAEEEVSSRQKRPLTPMPPPREDSLTFMFSHAGRGMDDDSIGQLQRQMSIPNSPYKGLEFFGARPIGTAGLTDDLSGQPSKRTRPNSDVDSSIQATSRAKDMKPPLPPQEEASPPLEKATSSEIASVFLDHRFKPHKRKKRGPR